MNSGIWFVTANINLSRILIRAHSLLNIFRNIHNHRTWSTCASNIKGFFQNTAKLFTITNGNSIFTDIAYYANSIYFLERIIAHQTQVNLACNTNERNTIRISSSNTSHKICSTRSRGYHTNPYFTSTTSISICRMGQCLLMTRQNHFYLILLI